MGLRYTIPFKDNVNTDYLVEIYQSDYNGSAEELIGAKSCFVVSGADDDFMYVPIRTSTATINVIDSDLLLGLYSINNQHSPVKLYRNGVLEWTGYISPEQFTQPYQNFAQNISVDCISAIASLEHIAYSKQTSTGYTTMWSLLKYIISRANGGYNKVYIPWVYARSSASLTANVMEELQIVEENFVSGEMNCLEVLEAVCKFFGWSLHDIRGNLWFVDADWKGVYRGYDETLTTYTEHTYNELTVQGIGFNGSDVNTLDVVPGYNKASVKSINNVFDRESISEDYDSLQAYADGEYFVATYEDSDEAHAVRRQFLKPKQWKTIVYDDSLNELDESVIEGKTPYELNLLKGAFLTKEADYKCVSTSDTTPAEGVTDFSYADMVMVRTSTSGSEEDHENIKNKEAVVMSGPSAVWADCGISIEYDLRVYYDTDLVNEQPGLVIDEEGFFVTVKVECGGKYYNGSAWVNTETTFDIEMNDDGTIKTNKTPYTPYRDLNGYIIPIDFLVGELKITIYCPGYHLLIGWETTYSKGVIFKGLKFGYAKKDGMVDEGEEGDRVYENIVNEAYMSETDEIEFEIGSYNADGASYSKALINGQWLTDNLYCAIVSDYIRPEELMIRRIVNRYGATKIKLTEGIYNTDAITPLTILSDTSMSGKNFRLTSGEWDYEQNRLTIQMQEDAE